MIMLTPKMIRLLRVNMNLTQKEFSELAKVSQAMLSYLENGIFPITPKMEERIIKNLGINESMIQAIYTAQAVINGGAAKVENSTVEHLWDIPLDEAQKLADLMSGYFFLEMKDFQTTAEKHIQSKRWKEIAKYGVEPSFYSKSWGRACDILEERITKEVGQ